MNARTTSSPLPLVLPLVLAVLTSAGAAQSPCAQSASEALEACRRAANADYWLARANCTNLPSSQKAACMAEAMEALEEALELCEDQHDERLDVCLDLGGGIYHPLIDPTKFVAGVSHPYFPLPPGVTRIYEKVTSEGVERVEVTPTGGIKVILGVACTEVRDVVSLDGELIEDTLDWFAQDISGNVWYFGELAMNFEDGELVDLDGSWRAGVDGAKPGIVMKATPRVGDVYRQEFLVGEAEDIAEVLNLSRKVVVPYGTFLQCIRTEDGTPLEPDVEEHKYYAPGIGLVLEVDLESGERTELVDVVME